MIVIHLLTRESHEPVTALPAPLPFPVSHPRISNPQACKMIGNFGSRTRIECALVITASWSLTLCQKLSKNKNASVTQRVINCT